MKRKILKILIIIFQSAFLIGVLCVWIFTANANNNRMKENADEPTVYFDRDVNDDAFNDADEVIKQVKQDAKKRDFYFIEKNLKEKSSIKNVDVYANFSGRIFIDIQEFKPLLRVENAKHKVFYITEDSTFMEHSIKYPAKVMLANGNIKDNDSILLSNLYCLAKRINKNDFLRDFIDEIYVVDNKHVEIYSKTPNQKIVFGNFARTDEKLVLLEAYFVIGMQKTGWRNYTELDLRYKDQIVCRNK
jgi:cell division protein FtsQ